MSVCLSVCLSVWLSVCLAASVCLVVSVWLCICICLCLSQHTRTHSATLLFPAATLDAVGLHPSSLSESGRDCVAALAACASALGVHTPRRPAYCAAAVAVTQRLHELRLSKARVEADIEQLNRQLRDVTALGVSVAADGDGDAGGAAGAGAGAGSTAPADATDTALRLADLTAGIEEARTNGEQYRAHIQALQEQQAGLDVEAEGVTHAALMAALQDVSDLEQQVARTHSELAQFHGLPPDLPAAQAKLDAATKELADTRAVFNELVDAEAM